MKKKTDKSKKALSHGTYPKAKERDKKGRFAKGHKGGPGRPRGEPRDIICKDGKTRSVSVLLDDLLGAYATMGGGKFLAKWAVQNHRNLTKFIDILFKFAPPPPTVLEGSEFKPLEVKITKVISDKRPKELGPADFSNQGIENTINELRIEIKARDRELQKLKAALKTHDIDPNELVHEPIIDVLPEHKDNDEDEGDHSDRRYK